MRTARTVRREAEKKESKPQRKLALPARGGGGGIQFFRDTYNELKKVVWPNREQTTHLSTVVIVISAAVGITLGIIDFIFTQLMQRYLVPGL